MAAFNAVAIERAGFKRHPRLGHEITGSETPHADFPFIATARGEESEASEIDPKNRYRTTVQESRTPQEGTIPTQRKQGVDVIGMLQGLPNPREFPELLLKEQRHAECRSDLEECAKNRREADVSLVTDDADAH
jgi:hypothetical protein